MADHYQNAPPPDAVKDAFVGELNQRLDELKALCGDLELVESAAKIDRIKRTLESPTLKLPSTLIEWSRLGGSLTDLIELIESEGSKRWVYNVTRGKAELVLAEFENWRPVLKRFHSISDEVASALNCFSVDEDTACIFHLMRIAEIGLRTLARERRVKIKRKPLEWAEWQDLISQIYARGPKRIANLRRGPVRDAALEFYNGALAEFEAFKDVYRNNVMHTRKTYEEHEARSVLLHVREFMARLSKKIGDDTTRAIVWSRLA